MVVTRLKNRGVSFEYFFQKNGVISTPAPRKKRRKPKSFSFFLSSIQTFILDNLSRENQIPLTREVENELINFLRDSYGIGKRFTACHQLLTDFNIIVHQFAENCLNNHPAKYVIKPDSFLIRIMNKSSSFSTEVVNGRVIRTSIPKNPRIRIKFTREKVTILNNQQNIILDNFIQMRLQQRYILFI